MTFFEKKCLFHGDVVSLLLGNLRCCDLDFQNHIKSLPFVGSSEIGHSLEMTLIQEMQQIVSLFLWFLSSVTQSLCIGQKQPTDKLDNWYGHCCEYKYRLCVC